MTQHIVFHNNCMDGFISAMLMLQVLKNTDMTDIALHSANYSDEPITAATGDTVYLVDFSYPQKVLDVFESTGVSVYTFDHHKSAILELEANGSVHKDTTAPYSYCQDCRDNKKGLFYFLSYNESPSKPDCYKLSGAALIQKIFFSSFIRSEALETALGSDITQTVELARQYDLWLHDGDTNSDAMRLNYWFKSFTDANKELFEKLTEHKESSLETFLELQEIFIQEPLEKKLAIGKEILDRNVSKIEEIVDKAEAIELSIPGYESYKIGLIMARDLKWLGISLAGSIMVRKYGWDVAILGTGAKEGDTQMVLSFRSNEKGSAVNVSAIVTEYVKKGVASSGGGHKHAAGMTLPLVNNEFINM